ncbi:glutenin, low molecular weight subunit-like [Abrus precatorius]|uniref:Glutenin, low molecular weight subunit-like n=1 Tax=Abrus precatorius TaxID=3816 RepID=A0A8B8L900_ABRPR|nr:glutenin, low molecular weight subunit-like [Abrus precatorius]
MVRHLAIGQQQVNPVSEQLARVCGICTSTEHPTDSCPTLQETDANVSGIYTNQQQQYRSPHQQQNYNPYSQTYNPGWRDHPNLKWGQQQQGQQSSFQPVAGKYQPPFRQQPPPPSTPPPAQRSEPSFQEMMQ